MRGDCAATLPNSAPDGYVIPMKKPNVGKVQRGVRRALIASEGAPLRTAGLLRWCYPRLTKFEHKHYRALYHAAPKFAVKLGKDGRAIIWGPKPEA